jgi:perosamine synthetase
MNSTKREKSVLTENPPLHFSNIFALKIDEGVFRKFYGKDAALFYFGRGALLHAVKAMRLSASDNVLVPSYHCGVEIEAVSMAGVQLRFYDIREDLTIELSDLTSKIDTSTKAVLLIHYFGFPQPVDSIKDICNAANILLIEDCSQALFSSYQGKPLGTFGDLTIFSQRKTLPLPDGGALLVNNPALASELPVKSPNIYVAIKKTAGMLFRAIFNCNPRNELPYPLERMATVFNRLSTRNSGISYSTGMEIDTNRCSLAMSGISKQIMNRTRIEYVIQRRRDNYTYLLRNLTATPCFRIVREQLQEGVCPLFFPVMIESNCRNDIQERLMRSGIGTFVFGAELHPSLPKDLFQEAMVLSRTILCLPVHQGLKPENMALIAETLLQATREHVYANTH